MVDEHHSALDLSCDAATTFYVCREHRCTKAVRRRIGQLNSFCFAFNHIEGRDRTKQFLRKDRIALIDVGQHRRFQIEASPIHAIATEDNLGSTLLGDLNLFQQKVQCPFR
ncbi:hypothetical protein D3C72_1881990 [compost metagenome]